MGRINYFFIILMLLAAFKFPLSSANGNQLSVINTTQPSNKPFYPNPNSSYISQHPLNIYNEAILKVLAYQYNWSGDGSVSHPFIIEHYFINSSNHFTASINLLDIHSHVIIRDNYLLASPNGSIGFKSPDEGSYGVMVSASSNIIIENNFILNQTAYGVIINDYSAHNASTNVLVDNNTIYSTKTSTGGIFIVRSNNLTLSNNTISNTNGAIQVFGGENLTISYNNLNFNYQGLNLDYTENSLIQYNIIAGNLNYGLKFTGIAPRFYINDTLVKGFMPNIVSNNDFISNNLDFNNPNMSQALDVGKNDVNTWNHNFWDNYPNSDMGTVYFINRTIGLNKYSYDRDPSPHSIRASQSFVLSVESLQSTSTKNVSWFFNPLFFMIWLGLIVFQKKYRSH